MQTNTKTHFFDLLQVLRGVAAIMVVFHHSIGSLKYYHHINYPFLNFIGSVGKFGVDFFFVLSGFIISFSATEKYGTPNGIKNYFLNRIIRIYVPYLPIGIAMFLIYKLLPGYSNSDRSISLLTSLTLLPDGKPALSVAWTLTFEVFFYLFFCISFVSKKTWNYFLLFWSAVIIYFNYIEIFPSNLQNSFFKIFLSTYNLEFILGYILACLINSKIKIKEAILWFGLMIFSALFIMLKLNDRSYFNFDINLIFVCASFIIIYLAIRYNQKLNKNALVMIIGNATYSIYLVHNPLQMAVIRLIPNINTKISIVISLLLVVTLSIGIGFLYSLYFEKKLITVFRNKLKI